jgi:DnaK suppressor protein
MPRSRKLDLQHLRDKLVARRQELLGMAASEEAAAERVEADQQRLGRLTRLDAMRAQAMAEETNRRRKVELKRIDVAVRKMDDGDYGYCEACGKAIAPGRLEFDPAASLCIACAERAEGR